MSLPLLHAVRPSRKRPTTAPWWRRVWRSGTPARRRRREPIAALVQTLEDRCLLAASIGGTYTINGQPTTVVQAGTNLTFINEFGDSAEGRFLSETQVIADGWGGLTGDILSDRIVWANGTTWIAAPGIVPDVGGAYNINGLPTSILQIGTDLTFINERGETADGRFLSSTQIIADGWGGLTGNVLSDRIVWANGTTWVVGTVTVPDVGGDYTINGRTASVVQSGTSLMFINERGEVANGGFLSSNQVIANDWGGLVGNLVGDRIEWVNGTTWVAGTLTVPDIAGDYTIDGQHATVVQSGTNLTFTNEHGDVAHGGFLSSTQVIANEWGGLTGNLVAGRIEWANGTTWTSNASLIQNAA